MATMSVQAERLRGLFLAMVAALLLLAAMYVGVATYEALPLANAQPLAGTDAQGFVNSSARCDPQQTPVVVGRTPLSLIAICADSRGYYEYRGMRLRDGALQRLPATELANGCFGAHTDAVVYTVSERKLLLTSGIRIVRDEAMLGYRDYRTPAAAPVSQQSAHQFG
jgi:hypothetical protein